jgi:hypothetical protein
MLNLYRLNHKNPNKSVKRTYFFRIYCFGLCEKELKLRGKLPKVRNLTGNSFGDRKNHFLEKNTNKFKTITLQ